MAKKIKQSPKLPADERKRQLLMSAQSLFIQKGYRDTTVDEIAKKAGVTKGALYFHYKSKEDMLFELMKHVTMHYYHALMENKERLKTPADFLMTFLDKGTSPCKEHEEIAYSLDFWVQAISIPRIKKYVNQHFDKMVDFFADTIDKSYGSRAERKDLAVLIYSLVDGFVVRQVSYPQVLDMKKQKKLLDKLFKSK